MPRSTQRVSAGQAVKAAAEAVVILSDLRDRSPQPDPQLDEQIDAFLEAGVVITRTAPTHTEN